MGKIRKTQVRWKDMKYRIEELNDQTWLIEEYDEKASAYMYLLTGTEKSITDRHWLWNHTLKKNM